MATLTPNDLKLLGYSEIETKKIASSWAIYSAKAVAGLESIESHFLYLKADCTVEQMRESAAYLSRTTSAYVITAKSCRIPANQIETTFGLGTKRHVLEDLIWNRLALIFNDYLHSIINAIPVEEYYVPPRKENADPNLRLDTEILDFLSGQATRTSGNLMVVCAPAGVGKTTLSRHIVKQLAESVSRNRVIPIYVEASHWGKLQLESVDDFWEIINNSIRAFSDSIRLDEDLFNHVLRQGYVAFIFDGFDELCTHKHSPFSPDEILKNLAVVVTESDAKVVLTTRTMYWEYAIQEKPHNAVLLNLATFNTQQAKAYFNKVFSFDTTSRDRAFTLYNKVNENALTPKTEGGTRAQFVNLPLCVVMIADYVRVGGTSLNFSRTSQITEQLLLQICDREVQRKSLKTAAMDQLTALVEIAIDELDRGVPQFDLATVAAAGFADADLGKLVDYPLFKVASDDSRLQFAYEFMSPYLCALYLARQISGQTSDGQFMWRIMASERKGEGFLLEHLAPMCGPTVLATLWNCANAVPKDYGDAKSFLFHLSHSAVSSDLAYKSARDRTNAIFSGLCGKSYEDQNTVKNQVFHGTIEGLDMRGITFERCTFSDVSFKRCFVDETTRFGNCIFSDGLEFSDEEQWALVRLDDSCSLLSPTVHVWNKVRNTCIGDEDENIRDAIRLGLSKFWHHGRLKSALKKVDWTKGILGHTKYCGRLIESMLKVGLVHEEVTSGVSEGVYVFERAAISDLQKFMDNRQMIGKVLSVFEMLRAQK